jgi:benzoate-CoA ligase family protein
MQTVVDRSGVAVPRSLNIASEYIDGPVARGHGRLRAVCYIGEWAAGARLPLGVPSDGALNLSYADLLALVNRGAGALAATGLEMEQRVALLLQDSPDWLAAFFGAVKLGAVPVPMNTILPASDYVFLLNDSRARVLVVDAGLWQALRERRPELPFLRAVLVVGEAGANETSWDAALLAAPEDFEAAPTTCDDVAFWLYSSGSTGAPKGAVHLQHDMLFCEQLYSRPILNLSSTDVVLSAAKLFHAYGLGNSSYFPFAAGARSVLFPGRTTPQTMFDLIARERVTVFFGVPTLFAQMLQAAETGAAVDCSSLRLCVSAAEPLPADIVRRWKARFGVDILDGIGTTEALHIFISNRAGEVRPGSSGKPLPGYDARIVDDDGSIAPPGEIGSLEIRGDSTLAYYWNQHERTKQTVRGEWVGTGDKYSVDPDGYFWYAGRNDDMLKVGGRWVSPAEVEAALVEHPSVLEAAVVAQQDADQLIKPKAYVILRDGVSGSPALSAELQDFVKSRIAPYKYPRWVEFVAELPKTVTGKIQRYKLRL